MVSFVKAMTGVDMMRTMMRFSPIPRLWLGFLIIVNLSALYFIDAMEAKVVLGVLAVSVMIMSAIHWRLGFVRLLGLGHILWFPMIVWLWSQLDQSPPLAEDVKVWMLVVMVTNGISLLIDSIDVIRYLMGEREPYY